MSMLESGGYIEYCAQGEVFSINDTMYPVSLDLGYADMFNLDLGWQVSGAAPDGIWERGVPEGTSAGGSQSNPGVDASDCGEKAYVTGNEGGAAGLDDVDFADAILTSPEMDLSNGGGEPVISLDFWWRNFLGQVTPNDSLIFIIDDGSNQYVVAEYYADDDAENWQSLQIDIMNVTQNLNTIKLIVKTADWDAEGGNLVEAGLDNFRVDYVLNLDENNIDSDFSVYPNPSNHLFNLTFGADVPESLVINIYDISGRLVNSSNIKKNNARVNIQNPGVYTIISVGEQYVGPPVKVVKMQ